MAPHARWGIHKEMQTRPLVRMGATALLAMSLASLASITLSARADAVPVPWKNCGTPTDPIELTKFDASVWPPQRGHSDVLTYTFQVGQAVDIRKEELTTSPKTELLDKAFSLPKDLSAGLYTNPPGGLVITVPTNIPPGTVYTVNVSFLDQSRTQVFCLDLTMPVK